MGILAVLLGSLLLGTGALAEEQSVAKGPADLVGTWVFIEDRTPPEQRRDPRERPPLGRRFSVALDGQVVTVERVRGGSPYVTRFPLDGGEQVSTVGEEERTHSGRFEDGCLAFAERHQKPGSAAHVSEFTLRLTKEGLIVRMVFPNPPQLERVALFRNAEDVPTVTPAKGDLGALAWLVGRFTGKQGNADGEEHWGPAGGGAMLGTARTVAGGRMVAFEFLRIVERDGGLVYVAQPGGGPAVEFVLTEIGPKRAVFENPLHDYPQRIVYERVGEDGLRTEISDRTGGRAHAAEYKRAK
jgi:hypothetical protein